MSPDLAALVERIARRLCAEQPFDPDELIESIPRWKFRASVAIDVIRAVAEATQEPSHEMMTAAAGPSAFIARKFAEDNWTDMHAASVLGEALRDE